MIEPQGTWRVFLGDLGDFVAGELILSDGKAFGSDNLDGEGSYRLEHGRLIVEMTLPDDGGEFRFQLTPVGKGESGRLSGLRTYSESGGVDDDMPIAAAMIKV